jgi:pSer/pThr/pTyr-binding forkhead associated (FHA) protein
MLAQLVALGEGNSILLDKPILLFGRHPECDVQIDSRKISRRHCCIAMVADYLVVRDLASTNGVRINGVRVIEGRLRSGDELTIGSHRYQVRVGTPSAPPRPAASVKSAPPLRAVQPAAPAASPLRVDDDLLEACDEPVPLAEPAAPLLPAALLRSAEESSDEIFPVLPGSPAPASIIPDHLELAPPSKPPPPVSPQS